MKCYEKNSDYILDVLKEKENELETYMFENLPEDFKFKFSMYVAIRDEIEKINSNI